MLLPQPFSSSPELAGQRPARYLASRQLTVTRIVGLYARASMGTTSAFVGIITFPFTQGNGFLSKYRPTTGGSDTNLQAAANSASPVWLILNRNGDTYTTYYSLDGNTLVSLGSQTQVMGSTIYVGVAATTADGVSISVTAQQIGIQTLANWSYNDTTVAQGTSYNLQRNVSGYSP